MRALDFPERAAPGASLILDFDIHAATVAHVDADDEYATRQSAGTMRARIGRQLTDQQDRIVGGGVAAQELGDKGPRPANLVTAAGKGKGVPA